jgi:hypothetical protein
MTVCRNVHANTPYYIWRSILWRVFHLGLEPVTTATTTATANTYSAAASIMSDAGATACNSVVGDLPGVQPLSPYSGYETGFDRSPSMASRTRTINSAAAEAAVSAAVAAVPVPLVVLPLSVTGLTVTGPVTVGGSGKRGSVAKLQRIPSAVQQHVQALPAVTPADVAATAAAAAAAAASRHASIGGVSSGSTAAAAAKRAATDDAAAGITAAAAALVAQSRTAHLTASSTLKKQGTATAASTTATADIVSSAAAAVQGVLSKLSVDTSRADGFSSRRSSFNSTAGSAISSANSSPVGSNSASLRRTYSNRYSSKENSEDISFRVTDKFADSNGSSSADLHSSSSRKVSSISSGLKRSTLADIDKLCVTSKTLLSNVVTDVPVRSSELDSEIDALLLDVADNSSTTATAAGAAAADAAADTASGAVTAAIAVGTAANATTTAASAAASASAAAGGAQVAVATRWIRQHVPDMVAMIPLLEMVMSCGFADTVATAVLDPETKHRRLDRLVIEIMKAAGASGPLLVVAENTQWMDMQSMKLMHKVSICAYTHTHTYIYITVAIVLYSVIITNIGCVRSSLLRWHIMYVGVCKFDLCTVLLRMYALYESGVSVCACYDVWRICPTATNVNQ